MKLNVFFNKINCESLYYLGLRWIYSMIEQNENMTIKDEV